MRLFWFWFWFWFRLLWLFFFSCFWLRLWLWLLCRWSGEIIWNTKTFSFSTFFINPLFSLWIGRYNCRHLFLCPETILSEIHKKWFCANFSPCNWCNLFLFFLLFFFLGKDKMRYLGVYLIILPLAPLVVVCRPWCHQG